MPRFLPTLRPALPQTRPAASGAAWVATWLVSVLTATVPSASWAQAAYAKVLEVAPVYQSAPVAQQDCADIGGQLRCQTVVTPEEQLVGYDVRYEYEGRQGIQRMAQDPGPRIPVQAASPSHSIQSTRQATGAVLTPHQKSYSSAPAGSASPQSIQYHSPAPTPQIWVDGNAAASQLPTRPYPGAHPHPHPAPPYRPGMPR